MKKGEHLSDDAKKKLSLMRLGEKNTMWKGDNVGYNELHNWVRRHKPKPAICEICGKEVPFDLANISSEYKRDVNDYQWICRLCHMKGDKRLEELNSRSRSPEFIKKNSLKRKGKKLWVNRPHPWIGRHHTDASVKKILLFIGGFMVGLIIGELILYFVVPLF